MAETAEQPQMMTAADVKGLRGRLDLSQDAFLAAIAAAWPGMEIWSRQTQSDIETGKIVLSAHDAEKIRTTFAEALTEAK